jgi:autotransporter-associated beta strand protein
MSISFTKLVLASRRISMRGVLLLLAGFAVPAAPAIAATRTWTGAGGNNQWTTAANWQGNIAPVAGDDLVFPSGGAQATNVNNYPALTAFAGISFGGNYIVTGNPITLTGPLAITGFSATTVTFSLPVSIATAPDLTVTIAANSTLVLGAPLSGAAGLVKAGAGTLRMTGLFSNGYTGLTTVDDGTLVLAQAAPAKSVPAGLVVGNGNGGTASDVVRLDAPEQIQGSITVTGSGLLDLANQNQTVTTTLIIRGQIKTGAAILTLNADISVPAGLVSGAIEGQLSLGGATRTIEILATTIPGLDIKASIVDGGSSAGLIKTGIGRLRLSGANSYTGPTTIEGGIVQVAHPQALGSPAAGTVVQPEGTLEPQVSIAAEPIATHSGSPNKIYCETTGAISLGGPIAISGVTPVTVGGACALSLDSAVTGPGELRLTTFTSSASITLNAVNTFTGFATILGDVRLGVNDALSTASGVQVEGSIGLDFQNHSQTMKYLIGQGHVRLGSATLTVDASQPQTDTGFRGVISGTGGVIKKGGGLWSLAGANIYTGPTVVQQGILGITGSIVSPLTIQGGTLQGNGTVATVAAAGGILEPINRSSPSKLTSGSIALTPGATFHAILNGPGAGTQYSQLAVAGTVDLGGAALDADVSSNFLTANVGELILIDNDGADPVVGTFQGLPQDSIVQSGGKSLRLSYVGGTGNDVTLLPTGNTYYLSEGATGSFFDTDILIANPNNTTVPVEIVFLKEDGTSITQTSTLAELSRVTIRVDDIVGVEAAAFSTIVTSLSGLPIVVERTMRWDVTGYGAHTDKATGGAAHNWYFAEGSQGFFSTYLLLTNPDASANAATVTFLREGLPPLERTYSLQPRSRTTIDLGNDGELVNTSFGMSVRFVQPGTAERAMYFGETPLWNGGHESAGETVTSANWFLAEGATGSFFKTFILIANTHFSPVDVTLTFLPASGTPVQKTKTVPARGRLTINVEGEDPSLTDTAVATQVSSIVPTLVVERAQYWPASPAQWYEAHNSFGVTAPGTRWGLAEGRVGGPEGYQTYVLLANPGTTKATATVTFLRESGVPLIKTIEVGATSRVNLTVGPGTDVPELTNERFGAIITADQPIVVERAMFWDVNGEVWSAGTNATATRLP